MWERRKEYDYNDIFKVCESFIPQFYMENLPTTAALAPKKAVLRWEMPNCKLFCTKDKILPKIRFNWNWRHPNHSFLPYLIWIYNQNWYGLKRILIEAVQLRALRQGKTV